jgi:integrase
MEVKIIMTGSLQIKNDTFYVVLNQKDENGKRKQKWVNTHLSERGNKKRAEKFMRELLAEYDDTAYATEDVKFVEYIEKWLETHKNQVDVVTWEGYKTNVEKHIVPYFKKLGLNLKEVTPKHIQKYYDTKFKNGRRDGKGGLSARSVKLHAIVINMVLKDAVLKELIPSNPAERAKPPVQDKTPKGKFYTVEQANKLLEVCKGEKIHPIVFLTLNYGLRRSEVIGLKVGRCGL